MTDNKSSRKSRSTHLFKHTHDSHLSVTSNDDMKLRNNTTTTPPSTSDTIILVADNKDILTSKKISDSAIIGELVLKWYSYRSVQCCRSLSRAFYLWSYLRTLPRTLPITSPAPTSSHMNENSSHITLADQKKQQDDDNMLRLESETNDTSSSSSLQGQMKQMKYRFFRSFVLMRHRSIQSMNKRCYFDIWLRNISTIRLISSITKQKLELQVGIQHVDSKRGYIKATEESNAKLKISLAMTVYFYRWRAIATNASMQQERDLYERQRRLIFNELIRIR